VADQEILAQFFNPRQGTLDKYSATTDANGKVSFTYTAPDDLPPNDRNITFKVDNGDPVLDVNVTLVFDNATYRMEADQNITVGKTDTHYQVKVALYKQESGSSIWSPATGKKVIADFLQPIYGNLQSYEVEVDNRGIALFEYVSPTRSIDINDTNITFYFADDHTLMDNTELFFIPETVEEVANVYVVPSSIKITEGNEQREITIVTVNAANVGISAEVSVEEPYDGQDDYGTITPAGTVTTDASGRVTLTYTAPSSISGLVERNITITELRKSLTSELNIKYEQATGPGVDYVITVNAPASLSVDQVDQITVVIHERGDETNVIDDADVYEVDLTSIFTNMLTFSNGSATDTYADAGTKPVQVETQTLSGSALIDINASIFNGDSNVTISKRVSVTVLSGPVAAMSLVYGSTIPDDGT
jgi:hypothetical protein